MISFKEPVRVEQVRKEVIRAERVKKKNPPGACDWV